MVNVLLVIFAWSVSISFPISSKFLIFCFPYEIYNLIKFFLLILLLYCIIIIKIILFLSQYIHVHSRKKKVIISFLTIFIWSNNLGVLNKFNRFWFNSTNIVQLLMLTINKEKPKKEKLQGNSKKIFKSEWFPFSY